jgi:hypothetical protein
MIQLLLRLPFQALSLVALLLLLPSLCPAAFNNTKRKAA